MAVTLHPRRGFEWGRIAWGHPDAPRAFLCSYCQSYLGNDRKPSAAVPLMLSADDGRVALFCDACVRKWWG